MAWRFQPSKFKNTTPKVPKKEETLFDLPIGTLSCTNNGIESCDKYLAFMIEGEGGKLGVLRAEERGRRTRKDMSVVCAHADLVDDFKWLPFEENKLVTCSRDDKLKVWSVGGEEEGSVCEVLSHSSVDVGSSHYLSALAPHSTAADIVAVASTQQLFVTDLSASRVVTECSGIVEKGLCVDWSEDGRMVAVSMDKGRQTCVFDGRKGGGPVEVVTMHSGMGREGRGIFALNYFISTGFTNKRVQEVRVHDSRNWQRAIHTQEYTGTTGVLIPRFDPDTKLLFLAGKGTNKLHMAELNSKSPHLSEVYEMNMQDQLLGFSLAPKSTVNVMGGEVCRVYQLTKSAIIPIPCIVPRRSYREVHVDLYPDTRGPLPACSAAEWLNGCDDLPEKVCIVSGGVSCGDVSPPPEPTPPPPPPAPSAPPLSSSTSNAVAHQPSPPAVRPRSSLSSPPSSPTGSAPSSSQNGAVHAAPSVAPSVAPSPSSAPLPSSFTAPSVSSPVPVVKMRIMNRSAAASSSSSTAARPISSRPKSIVVGQVQSKFRHVETLVGVKAGAVFSNVRNVNTRLPTECNGAVASDAFVALPLSGPAGIILILDVNKAEKLPDGVLDGIYNKAQVTDLQWNPFDASVLAVGTDEGVLNVWRLTEERGEEEKRADTVPWQVVKLGGEKVTSVRWHPLAADLVAVALSDASISLYTLSPAALHVRSVSHSLPILSLAWSLDGRSIASIGKDLSLHVWDARMPPDTLQGMHDNVVESTRGARVVFACNDALLVVVGLTKSSSRVIHIVDARSEKLPLLHSLHVDSAVQPLVPHYDTDTSVLFLTAKGDRSVLMFEVIPEPPYLLPLSTFTAPSAHQSIAFHNKSVCNVMEVEFQRAWRITDKSVELMKFRVPRVKKDVFQSDLFPDAYVSWKSAMSAQEWLQGSQEGPKYTSLQPEGVSSLALPSTPQVAKLAKRSDHVEKEEKEAQPVQKEVMSSWSQQIAVDNTLEQDKMEGVAEEEWN